MKSVVNALLVLMFSGAAQGAVVEVESCYSVADTDTSRVEAPIAVRVIEGENGLQALITNQDTGALMVEPIALKIHGFRERSTWVYYDPNGTSESFFRLQVYRTHRTPTTVSAGIYGKLGSKMFQVSRLECKELAL